MKRLFIRNSKIDLPFIFFCLWQYVEMVILQSASPIK